MDPDRGLVEFLITAYAPNLNARGDVPLPEPASIIASVFHKRTPTPDPGRFFPRVVQPVCASKIDLKGLFFDSISKCVSVFSARLVT
jgi:hypothetical protein